MKKGKHTEEQIIGVLKQVEAGRTGSRRSQEKRSDRQSAQFAPPRR
jgi:hypothetical protein